MAAPKKQMLIRSDSSVFFQNVDVPWNRVCNFCAEISTLRFEKQRPTEVSCVDGRKANSDTKPFKRLRHRLIRLLGVHHTAEMWQDVISLRRIEF